LDDAFSCHCYNGINQPIQKETKMKVTRSTTIAIFIALTIAGVCLVVFGQAAGNSAVSVVLPLLGASIFGSALTYFLVKMA
jgi:hypothetical protein